MFVQFANIQRQPTQTVYTLYNDILLILFGLFVHRPISCRSVSKFLAIPYEHLFVARLGTRTHPARGTEIVHQRCIKLRPSPGLVWPLFILIIIGYQYHFWSYVETVKVTYIWFIVFVYCLLCIVSWSTLFTLLIITRSLPHIVWYWLTSFRAPVIILGLLKKFDAVSLTYLRPR